MSPKVQKILEHCEESDIEIVSYGLAPNSWGFCYEAGKNTTEKQCKKMNTMLKALNVSEERELKREVFG